MLPANVKSILIRGKDVELKKLLFKCAFYYAEIGLNVWFISSQQFDCLPKNLEHPNRDILKLITFLYLKNLNDLIMHLNSIHLWHQCPQLIILSDLELYCGSLESLMDSVFIVASSLDATSSCAHKSNLQNCYLIVTHDGKYNDALKTYFSDSLICNDDCNMNSLFIKIKDIFVQ